MWENIGSFSSDIYLVSVGIVDVKMLLMCGMAEGPTFVVSKLLSKSIRTHTLFLSLSKNKTNEKRECLSSYYHQINMKCVRTAYQFIDVTKIQLLQCWRQLYAIELVDWLRKRVLLTYFVLNTSRATSICSKISFIEHRLYGATNIWRFF